MGEDPPQGGPGIEITVLRDRATTRLPLADRRIRALATYVLSRESVRHAAVSFSFVGRRQIATVHRRLTGVPGPTDIVTLQHVRWNTGAPVVGEIWISPEVARDNARALGTTFVDECRRLVVHGVLHALGWEHPEGDGREQSPMWRRQERLLRDAARRGIA